MLLIHSRRTMGNVIYWSLTGLVGLLLTAAGGIDLFKLWGVTSLGERWVFNTIAALVAFFIWGAGSTLRYFLRER